MKTLVITVLYVLINSSGQFLPQKSAPECTAPSCLIHCYVAAVDKDWRCT